MKDTKLEKKEEPEGTESPDIEAASSLSFASLQRYLTQKLGLLGLDSEPADSSEVKVHT